jgi:hypothetical protein
MSVLRSPSSLFGAFLALAIDRLLDSDLHLGKDPCESLAIPVKAAGQDDGPLTIAALTAAVAVLEFKTLSFRGLLWTSLQNLLATNWYLMDLSNSQSFFALSML